MSQVNSRPATKSDVKVIVEKSVLELQEVLVGGMNQMLETLISHIDRVDKHVGRVEEKLGNYSRVYEKRISKLEKQKI